MTKRKFLGLGLAIITLLFLVDLFVVGIQYMETGAKANFFLNGSYIGIPYSQFYLKDLYLIGDVIAYLYTYASDFPWIAFIFTSLFLISICIIVYNTQLLLHKHEGNYRIFFIIIPFIIFLNYNFLEIDHTSTAFLLCTASYSTMTIALKFRYSVEKKIALCCISTLFFFTGTLVRNEAALGTSLIAIPALFYMQRNNLLAALKAFIPVLVISIVFNGLFIYNLNFSSEFYYQVEPDFEYELMDRENIVPLYKMKTREDSLGYWAVSNWMLADSSVTSPLFIRSLINKENQIGKNTILIQPDVVLAKFKLVFQDYRIWFVLFFLIGVLSVAKNTDRKFILIYFTYALFILLSVLGGVSNDFHHRFSLPVFSVFMTLVVPLISYNSDRKILLKFPKSYLLGFFLILCVLVLSLKVAYEKSNKQDKLIAENIAFFRKVNELKKHYYLVWASDGAIFDTGILTTSIIKEKKVVPIDFVQYSYSDLTKKVLRETTNCPDNDFKCRFQFLINHRDSVLLIGNSQRLSFYSQYLKKVYQIEFDYLSLGIKHPSTDDELFTLK